VQQIDHVELFVPDRDEAAAWYERVLGLEIVDSYRHWAENPHGPLMISPDGGSTKLALFTGIPRGTRETAGFHLVAFRVDAAGFLTFLKRIGSGELELYDEAGTRLTHNAAVDHRQAWSIYFCDAWSHRLEITSYEYEEIAMRLGRLMT
jgi:catechol 2,3-dioxygenase-like lactoylglutathione lyase family enzyme